MTVDSLNKYECITTMPKEMVVSVVAQDLQNMTHWGGVRANIQCTLASKSKLKSIVGSRVENRQEEEQDVSFPKQEQVNTQMPIKEMIGKMMTGILNSVDEKLRSIREKSLPCVSDQSFATNKVIPSPVVAPDKEIQNSLKEGGTPGPQNSKIILFQWRGSSRKKMRRHMSNGSLIIN